MMKAVNKTVLLLAVAMIMGFGASQEADAASKVVKSVSVSDNITNSKSVVYMAKGTKRKLVTGVKLTKKKYNKPEFKKLVISSSKPKIVSINKNGTLKAKKTGKSVITVTSIYDNRKKTINVIVKPGKVKSVTMNCTSITMKDLNYQNKPEQTQLSAIVKTGQKDTMSKLYWKSSDEEVITVDPSGKITAVAPGTARVTACAIDGSGKKASCKVEVVKAVKENPDSVIKKPEPVVTVTKEKKTVISIVPNVYITVTLSIKGDYKRTAYDLERVLEKISSSGDQFEVSVNGKKYIVANENGSMLVTGDSGKIRLSDVFDRTIEDVTLCLRYTEEVSQLVNKLSLTDLQGEYGFDLLIDQFSLKDIVVKGNAFNMNVDGKTYSGTIDNGIITLDGDLSKEPFFILAVEKKYISYQITEKNK